MSLHSRELSEQSLSGSPDHDDHDDTNLKPHLVALAAALGAWSMFAVWWPLLVGLLGLAIWHRKHVGLWMLLAFLVVGTRGQAQFHALDPPSPQTFVDWVDLLEDPRPVGDFSVVATVGHGHRRLRAIAHGSASARFDDALAGEKLLLRGTLSPLATSEGHERWKHVVGRLSVAEVLDHQEGSVLSRFANGVRRILVGGAESLSRSDKAVFLGMVIGDDRGQTAVVADDFRAAGLGHLLVVSGQNVAFVLAVCAPLVGRFRPAYRALWLFGALLLFAVITRFEPSVLRAVTMAAAGIGASALGTPLDGKRALSGAIAALLVIDPFLVRSVAFQLSVAATAGIVWLSGPLAERFKGPRWLAIPLATTASAQLAVSPVLLGLFGPLPMAALPANFLAGPISGAVMIWGCSGGLLAGFLGGFLAEVLHWPSKAMLWWIGGVASQASVAPQATLGAVSMVLLGVAAMAALSRFLVLRFAAAFVGFAVGLLALVSAPTLGVGTHKIGGESTAVVANGGQVILVLDDPPTRRLVEALRLAGARNVAMTIALDGDRRDAHAVLALNDRYGKHLVVAPPNHRVPGGRSAQVGQLVKVDDLTIEIESVRPRLEVSVYRNFSEGEMAAIFHSGPKSG